MDFAEPQQHTSSTEAEESPYEMESESFHARPLVKSITVPETVKRRVPTKHYVSQLASKLHAQTAVFCKQCVNSLASYKLSILIELAS